MIRDPAGGFMAGFSSFYGMGSKNKAELSAVLDGLKLCLNLKLLVL